MSTTAAIIPVNYFNTFIGKKTSYVSSADNDVVTPWIPIFPSIWYGAAGYSAFEQNVETDENIILNRNWFIEESRIQGGFNNTIVSLGVKAYANVDNPDQLHRSNSLIYSGVFNSRTGFNETNVFSISDSITKSVDPFNGSIQYLYTSDSNLIVFQERKTGYLLVDKDALYTAEGSANVTSTDLTLGQYVPFAGNYGISKNPESFATFGFRKYFSDVHRGKVMRLSVDGLTPISDNGMTDFFRDQSEIISDEFQVFQVNKNPIPLTPPGASTTFSLVDVNGIEYGMGVKVNNLETQAYVVDISSPDVTFNIEVTTPGGTDTVFTFFKYVKDKVVGAWDNFGSNYTLSYQKALLQEKDQEQFTFLNNDKIENTSTLSFDESVTGWSSYYTYRPDIDFSLKGNFYSFKNAQIWKHYSEDVINNRGVFYNTANPSSVEFVINAQPSVKKVFQTINYEGDNGFEMVYLKSDLQRVDPDYPYTNPLQYLQLNEYQDITSDPSQNLVSVSSYQEGEYFIDGYPARAGFDRKENLYVANLVNRSTVRPGEVIYGNQMSGVKGYFVTAKIATDKTTNPGGLKELWTVGSKYVVSS